MRKDIPAGVLELLSVPGLRPEKVLKLYSELGIASLEGLERAARQDRLKNVRGLGAALQSKILQGIDIKRRGEGQRHLHRAAAFLEAAEANLRRSHPGLTRITPAGDFRRGCELVSDLSLVAEVPKLDGGKTIRVSEQLTVHLVEKSRYGITLLLATGSAQHVDGLRALAATEGFRLDGQGLRRGHKIVAAKEEEDIYAALGLPFIAPELREGPRFAAFLAERLRRAANGHAPPPKPADASLRPNAGPKATHLKSRDTRQEGAEQISR